MTGEIHSIASFSNKKPVLLGYAAKCRYIYVNCHDIFMQGTKLSKQASGTGKQSNSLLSYFGGAKNAGVKQIDNALDLIHLIRVGIAKRGLSVLSRKTSLSMKEIARAIHISERTLQRYSDDRKLDKATTEKVIELAQLYQHGVEVFGSHEKFDGWMRHPSVFFGGKLPVELLDTTTGISLIHDELTRIEYGVFA